MRKQSEIEQLIRQRALEGPDEVWLKFKDQEFRWKEVISLSQRCANGLLELGVRPGDPVGIMATNKPEFIWVYFAILMIGGVVVPLNRHQRGAALVHMVRDSGITALAFDEDLSELVAALRPECPALRWTVSFGARRAAAATVDFARLLQAPDREPEVDFDIASGSVGILYTSGTTGVPKGIVADRYEANLRPVQEAMRIKPGETIYACMPLFHGNALIISTTGSIRFNARLALAEGFSASRFWDDIRRYGAVEANAMGGVIPILLKQPRRPDDRDNPMRIMLSVGCPLEAWREFEERFDVRIHEFYGSSDACGFLLNVDGIPGSAGKPVDGAEFRIVDANDVPLPAGQLGEIIWRHPWGQANHYHNLPEATAHAYRGGWYHSGDLGEMDARGYYYFRGRLKEVIRRRGENISAWEVTSTVDSHPDVLESAAYGVPSEMGEEEVMVAVVRQPGSSLDAPALLDFCAGRLAYFAMPRYVDFVDRIPRTGNQKVQQLELKSRGVTASTWDRERMGYQIDRDAVASPFAATPDPQAP